MPDLAARLEKVFGRRVIPDGTMQAILDQNRREHRLRHRDVTTIECGRRDSLSLRERAEVRGRRLFEVLRWFPMPEVILWLKGRHCRHVFHARGGRR